MSNPQAERITVPVPDLPIGGLIAVVGELKVEGSNNKIYALPAAECLYVQLALWTATDAPGQGVDLAGGSDFGPSSASNIDHPIYYGFNGRLFAQLFPGDTTGLIPIDNVGQISVKPKNGDTLIVRYVYFRKP